MNWRERIIIDSEILTGKLVIKGTRLAVSSLSTCWLMIGLSRRSCGITITPDRTKAYVTSLRHYQSLSFTDYEMRDIEKRLIEWGILRKRF